MVLMGLECVKGAVSWPYCLLPDVFVLSNCPLLGFLSGGGAVVRFIGGARFICQDVVL